MIHVFTLNRNAIAILLVLVSLPFSGFAQVPTNGLVAWYPFTNSPNDQSGNGFTGTADGAVPTNDRFAVANAAYRFDGTDDIFSFGNILDSVIVGQGQQFAISLWVQQDSGSAGLGVSSVLVSKYAHSGCGAAQRQFAILMDGPDVGCYFAEGLDNSSWRIAATNDAPLATQATWHHVVINYDGSQNGNNGADRVEIYVDSVAHASDVVAQNGALPGEIVAGTAPLGLGGYIALNETNCGIANFLGELDDFRMYNRLLTKSEVVELFLESDANARNLAQIQNVRVFPQPAPQGSFQVSWESQHPKAQITLSDLKGLKVYQQDFAGNQANLALSDLSPGIYLLTLRLGEGIIHKKVMLQ